MDYVADRVHHALTESNDDVSLETLLKSGLNPDNVFISPRYPDINGKTFLQICCSSKSYSKVQLLIQYGCHVNYAMKEVISPCERRIDYVLDKEVQDLSYSCLYYAICSSDEKLVRILLKSGADVSLRCQDKMTALMHAVDDTHIGIVRAIAECKGCDINAQDVFGLSALHIAAIHGNTEVVEYLLKKRARIDIQQCQGGTPLFVAHGRRTVKLLLSYGADPNHVTQESVTAMSCFLKKCRRQWTGIVTDMLDAGCKIPQSLLRDTKSAPPEVIQHDQTLLDLLQKRATNPVPLKLQSNAVIRKTLNIAAEGVGLGFHKTSELLPLPKLLKQYVRDFGLRDSNPGSLGPVTATFESLNVAGCQVECSWLSGC